MAGRRKITAQQKITSLRVDVLRRIDAFINLTRSHRHVSPAKKLFLKTLEDDPKAFLDAKKIEFEAVKLAAQILLPKARPRDVDDDDLASERPDKVLEDLDEKTREELQEEDERIARMLEGPGSRGIVTGQTKTGGDA